MITGGSFAVAIEAKYTEPPYETVRAWLGSSPSDNRQSVLRGWLDLIRDATGATLTFDQIADRPYQLVHRAASACYPKAVTRWVVYQLFSDASASYYRAHLAALSGALGGQSALRLGTLVSPPEPSAAFTDLAGRWTAGDRDLSAAVRSGLVADSLFGFNHIAFTELTAPNDDRRRP